LLRSAAERARVVEQVRRTRASGRRIVVVASAMGRDGEPYATDTLLHLASEIDPPVDARTQDLLISCGEVISTTLLAHVLTHGGHAAVPLTGAQAGIVTDEQFGAANILSIQPLRVLRALRDGLIPVVAGFQGRTAGGDTTTLGRGGSDISAVALAIALRAEVEIFKDVQGIMTADPRVVPAARRIARMTYHDAAQAGWMGACVLHPRAAELAREYQVHLSVRPLLGPPTSGTEFLSDDAACAPCTIIVHARERDSEHARISIVGSGVRQTVDTVQRARCALAAARVPLLALERDMTQSMITCVVAHDSLEAAARALHRVFVEDDLVPYELPELALLERAS
jgi:aspartokinase